MDQPTKRGRGRPRRTDAKTSAERQALYLKARQRDMGEVAYALKDLLQQTAGRLRQGDGAPSASWPAQAGHPRLAVLVSAEGVDGGPSAAMTIRTDRPSSSGAPTYLRFAVAPRFHR